MLRTLSFHNSLKEACRKEVENSLENTPNLNNSIKSMFSKFKSGGELACKVINNYIKYLKYRLVNVINSFNLDWIIIGGRIVQAGYKFPDGLKQSIKQCLSGGIYDNTFIDFSSIKSKDEVALETLVASKSGAFPCYNIKDLHKCLNKLAYKYYFL